LLNKQDFFFFFFFFFFFLFFFKDKFPAFFSNSTIYFDSLCSQYPIHLPAGGERDVGAAGTGTGQEALPHAR
jgi:hypothetical protein